MLVHAYVTSPGKAKWSGPHRTIQMLHFVLSHSATCYTDSIVSCIHVNTTELCNITCTLVATNVILWCLECIAKLVLLVTMLKGMIQQLGRIIFSENQIHSGLILSCEGRDENIYTTSIRGFCHMVNNYTNMIFSVTNTKC